MQCQHSAGNCVGRWEFKLPMDRFPENAAPIRRLPIDPIGARHYGMVLDAGTVKHTAAAPHTTIRTKEPGCQPACRQRRNARDAMVPGCAEQNQCPGIVFLWAVGRNVGCYPGFKLRIVYT